jgi:hypothetical protein
VRSRELSFLLPTAPPVADPAATSAEFVVLETVPTHVITLEAIVRQEDDANPVVAVQSWVGQPPSGSGDARKVRIRGQEGFAQTPAGAVSMLDWAEHGQQYHAEWVGMPLDQMIAWLDTWESIL